MQDDKVIIWSLDDPSEMDIVCIYRYVIDNPSTVILGQKILEDQVHTKRPIQRGVWQIECPMGKAVHWESCKVRTNASGSH